MSDWDFRKESNETAEGDVGSVASFKAGMQPCERADVKSSKRNVIATSKGWVRRTIKNNGTDTLGVRLHDEVLVAAGGKVTADNLGFPNIAEIYLSANSTSDVKSGAVCNVYVVFNEPIKHSGLAGNMKLASFANTAGGKNDVVATHTAGNANSAIINANNTLVFSVTPAGDGSDAGDYKITSGASAIVVNGGTAINCVSENTGNRAANLHVTPAVSNTLGTFTVTA